MRDFGFAGSPVGGIWRDGRRALPEVARLRRAAWAFTTRRVPRGSTFKIVTESIRPKAGDLILARVEALGHHASLQLANGRRKHLFVGDEIVVVYGNRYASNQFEAVVPESLGPCHLVAGGGVAAKARSWHAKISRGPTEIVPIGLLGDAAGQPLNVGDYALQAVDVLDAPCPTAVAVVGTGMDSGKTQTAAYLVRGLTLAGLRVGYAKVTGTGAGGDTWLLKDAGANPVLDFTDAGLVSTYLSSPADLERVLVTLVAHLTKASVEAVVLEVADGVLQQETAALLKSSAFREVVSAMLFTACDAMGAVAGHAWLQENNLPIVGFGGVLTASPLQSEEALQATGLRAFSREELCRPGIAMRILARARRFAATATELRSEAS